jgi:hypothetical protein
MDHIHLWWMLRIFEIPSVPVSLINCSPCASELLVANGMVYSLYLLAAINLMMSCVGKIRMGTVNAGCSLVEAMLRYNMLTEANAISAGD